MSRSVSDDDRLGPVRAVVFDFGGVLITPITNQLADVASSHGVPMLVMKEVLLGPRDSTADHPWHRAERGELATDAIQGELGPWAELAGVELRGDEIERVLAPGAYSLVDSMHELVDRLPDVGMTVGLLTNTFAEFQPTMQRDVRLERFDVVVESFAVGARKPEDAIYGAVESEVAAWSIAPEEILYLDDFDQNLAPAIDRGWQTVHVTDPHATAEHLAARFLPTV